MNLSEPADLVMSRATAALLRVLAGAETAFSIRQAARLAGISAPRAVEIVNRAQERGLVLVEQAGNARMCRLNRDHLAADAIICLLTLRRRLVSALEQELATWVIQPVHASLFGSAARGDGDVFSDLDVLIVRPDGAADGPWSDQRYNSGVALRLATGNPISWFDVAEGDLARTIDEPLVQSWRADHIHLTGARLDLLLRRSTAD